MNFVREMIAPQISEKTPLKSIKKPNKPKSPAKDKTSYRYYKIDYSQGYITYIPTKGSNECTCGLCAHPRACIPEICHPTAKPSANSNDWSI